MVSYSSTIFNIIVKVVQRVRHGGYLNGSLNLFVPYYQLSCLVKTLKNSNLQDFFAYIRQDVYIGFTECLGLRTRNGRLKNSLNPGGTLPTHPVGPKKWTCGACLNWPSTSFSYLQYVHYVLAQLTIGSW